MLGVTPESGVSMKRELWGHISIGTSTSDIGTQRSVGVSSTGALRCRMESPDPRARHSASCAVGLILDRRRIVSGRQCPGCGTAHRRRSRRSGRGPEIVRQRGTKGDQTSYLCVFSRRRSLYRAEEAKPSALDPVNSSLCRDLGCVNILGSKVPALCPRRVGKSLAEGDQKGTRTTRSMHCMT